MADARDPRVFAMIGAGYQAVDSRLPALKQLEGEGLLSVPAIVNHNLAKAETASEEFEIPAAYDSIAGMLAAEPTVGSVVICTPHHVHAENALVCMEAGVNVLVEKPISTTVREGLDMLDAAEAHGVLLCPGYQYPEQIRHSREAVESGRLGRLNLIEGEWLRRDGVPPQSHFWHERLAGGVLIDLGVHILSAVLYLVGGESPSLVGATAGNEVGQRVHGADFRAEDTASLTLVWPGETQASVHVSWAAAVEEEDRLGLQLWGSTGALRVPLMGAGLDVENYRPTLFTHRRVSAAEAGERLIHLPSEGDEAFVTETERLDAPTDTEACFVEQTRHFVAACAGEGEILFSAKSAVDIQRIVSAAKFSAEHGGRQVDLNDPDDLGASLG